MTSSNYLPKAPSLNIIMSVGRASKLKLEGNTNIQFVAQRLHTFRDSRSLSFGTASRGMAWTSVLATHLQISLTRPVSLFPLKKPSDKYRVHLYSPR